ncbi:hypothetical protein TNCV_2767621 [Trichonephila clavipes]|nr:hypothetical protein TNCV_2767621 [Trichonephila clavipes]
MITNFFIPELNNHDVQELWFQQHSSYHNRFIERHPPREVTGAVPTPVSDLEVHRVRTNRRIAILATFQTDVILHHVRLGIASIFKQTPKEETQRFSIQYEASQNLETLLEASTLFDIPAHSNGHSLTLM